MCHECLGTSFFIIQQYLRTYLSFSWLYLYYMDEFDKILEQLKDSSGELKHNFRVLEEIVPIEEQMHYFDYSKKVRNSKEYVNRDYLIARLFSPDSDVEDRRYCLVMLAGVVDIAAYRAIETYHSSPLDPELKNWSAMALTESRILIDSDLSGEQQIFVSTGLGGSNNSLRFFSIIASKDRVDFNDLQHEIIDREFRFELEHNQIAIEDFTIKENYARLMLLSDLKHDLRNILTKIIKECNELGDFLDEKFMLTNVKAFDDTEIERLLKKKPDSDKNQAQS